MKILLPVTIIALIFLGNGPRSAADELPVFRAPLEVEIQVLDPVEAEDFVTIRVLQNLGSGLVTLNKSLEPVPRLADSWQVSKDGREYVFKIGKHFWSDGTPVTSSDFVRGFERTFSPLTAAKIAAPMLELVENAREYKTKKISDFSQVGVKAPDEKTFVVKLKRAATFFPALLALPVAFPHPNNMSDYKIKPGVPTSGPYVLDSIKPEGLKLSPNPKASDGALNRLEFKIVTDGSAAIALYEKKELDAIFKIPSADFKRFKDSPEINTSPWLSTYYLGFNVTKGFFKNKALREAVIAGVDRAGLNKILLDPQKVSSSWVPSPFPTSDESFGPKFDPPAARKLWKENAPKNARVTLYFDTQEKNTVITAFIQQQLKNNVGADVELHGMEWKSYLHFLKSEKPDFFRFGWLAAFPDPLSHLGVFTSDNPNNDTGYANPEYDKLVAQIASTPKGNERTELIRKAQKKLLSDDVVIFPLYHYMQYILIAKGWTGYEVTPMGLLYFHRLHRDRRP